MLSATGNVRVLLAWRMLPGQLACSGLPGGTSWATTEKDCLTVTAMTSDRADSLRRARQDLMDQWFRGRHWRVLREFSGRREPVPGIVILFDHGEFWITGQGPAGEVPVFQTAFGKKGQHGFIVREVDEEGHDLEPVVQAAFGFTQLQVAASQYGAVAELPRPRKSVPAAWR